MRCGTCGAEVDPSGVFPGGTVTCRCGTRAVVGAPPSPQQTAYRTAPARHQEPVSQAHPAPESKRHCCTCLQPLVTMMRDGHVLHGCQLAHGVFVEADELEAMLRDASRAGDPASSATPPPSQAQVRYVRCPACGEVMARRSFAPMSGVIVDVCEHGTWFDAGELDQALAFAASHTDVDPGALRRTAPRPAAGKALLDVSLSTEASREADVLEDLLDVFGFITGIASLNKPSRDR